MQRMKEKIHVYKATGVKTNRQKDEKPQKRKFHCHMEGGNRKANIAFKHKPREYIYNMYSWWNKKYFAYDRVA